MLNYASHHGPPAVPASIRAGEPFGLPRWPLAREAAAWPVVGERTTGPSPLAGQIPAVNSLLDIPALITAYYSDRPDPAVSAQRVAFGTSGHRGTSFLRSFNEWHILAITQAICQYRAQQGITGPLYMALDTHALSLPAYTTALEVLAANHVDVMLAEGDAFTPTPVVSHAILAHNRRRASGLADGIVVTPSQNPPRDGGIKYDPPHGGPADTSVTAWIEARANALLEGRLADVRRVKSERARRAATTHRHDFMGAYVADLGSVVDLAVVRDARLAVGVDPLGGAGVHYWPRIAEHYGLDLTVVSDVVDPTFRFMTLDRDGRIRMDPSSPWAMKRLIALKDRYDIAFACDTDHDRHGVVTRSHGLLPPDYYLAVASDYLFRQRSHWPLGARVGKTLVCSQMIDRVAARLGRPVFDVPVGFKWFVEGLLDGSLAFGGEASAGAVFARRDGGVWTTDKDGIVSGLLAAEITARTAQDPGELYQALTRELGDPVAARIESTVTPDERAILASLSAEQVTTSELAGEPITAILTRAPGNDAAIGGLKVTSADGWFVARPSGTESVYKVYAESFRDRDHLQRILEEAQAIVGGALAARR